jgi:hypothetical protein
MLMPLARNASLVVMLVLLSVGTASAECAWVLWQKRVEFAPRKSLEWTADIRGDGVYATRKACDQAREFQHEVSLTVHNQNKSYQAYRSSFGVTVKPKGSDKMLFAVGWDCFPDTIDPRAAKWQ